MKKYTPTLILLLLLLLLYVPFTLMQPRVNLEADVPENQFSVARAFKHVEAIAREPHGVGFPAHEKVREYLLGELRKLGLNPILQTGYTAGDWGNYSRAVNILARIKGRSQGKALMLLSHYDSSPHSSLGASDDGSGLATILEGLRAFLATGTTPENDIIILFSDAEELGLNGADLFVNEHPWASDVGLVLNFEARGSGGPSFMLIETNRGNSRLISEFKAADPGYPQANSLMYSIYKLLPNDTDLTVFREDRDIEGFNFAFIDDHYDYHTVLDRTNRLDPGSLAHQGSYLMPLLNYFANADLGDLKSLKDDVYFNMPWFGLISYPYDWIWPLFIFAVMAFFLLLAYGLRKGELQWKAMGAGMLAMVIVIGVNGVIGYFSWPILKWLYPGYREILHGFTYNGHAYIAAFVFLSIAICSWVYKQFRKVAVVNLLPAPLLLWLFISYGLASYLPGASFLIFPVFALLAGFLVLLYQKEGSLLVLALLAVPALWLLGPLIAMFPVGLGLKMMVSATVVCTLTYLLLLPVLGSLKGKGHFGSLFFLLFAGFMVAAHFNSDFDKTHPRPTSLLYVSDVNSGKAYWATYDNLLSDWTSQFVTDQKPSSGTLAANTLSSKYSTGFTYTSEAPVKAIEPPEIEILKDTLQEGKRIIVVSVIPQRPVNRLEVYTGNTALQKVTVNGLELSPFFLQQRKGPRLLTHYISDNEATRLQLTLEAGQPLELTFYEASNNLLNHPLFSVPGRPETEIPKPFVLNDAILLIKSIRFE
jgi:hypothetical protein